MNVASLRDWRPTRVESALAAILLCLALVEAVFSDEQPKPSAVRLVAAVVPAVAVAFSRSWPDAAAVAVTAVLVLAALQQSPSGTLGAGIAWLAVAFAMAAWSSQPWPWLAALIVAGTLRDLRTVGDDITDVVIDWVFVGFTVWIGRIVHRRTVQSAELTSRLGLVEAEREARAKEAVTRERSLIARELHDIVAHSVSLMVVQAGTARPLAQRTDGELAGVLDTVERTGREALSELRRLLRVLRSEDEPALESLPDLSRLDELIQGVRDAGLDIQARLSPPADVAPGVALCAYRAVQEGLTNAIRYASGSRVTVDVAGDRGSLVVAVRDAGGTTRPVELGTGTGLVGLRERVLLCGGHMLAGSDGSGYLLKVTLPLAVDHPDLAGPHRLPGDADD